MAGLLTIFLPIFVVFIAIVYMTYKDLVVISGYYREPAQKYTGGKCRKLEGLDEICEDIKIHHTTGLAYLTCGDEQSRKTQWFPPNDVLNYSYHPRETFYVYNTETDKLTPLALKNFADEEDFSLHGFGMYEDPAESGYIYFFLINHRRTGSVIELFKHKINSFELHHLKTFKHDLIYNPNNVVPVSKDEFYLTNDLYCRSWKRHFELLTRRSWSNVVFHSSKTNTTEIAADGLMFANGINTNWDYSHVFVGTVGTGELLVYERKPDNKLKLLEAVQVEYAIDNVSVDPVTGEIYLAALDSVTDVYLHLNGIKDAKLAFSVLKVSNNTGENKFYGIKYEKKKIFEDDGTLFGAVSVAAGDSVRKIMLLGSFHTPGVIRCELN